MGEPVDWQKWTALNRQLLEQWRNLISRNPGLASAKSPFPENLDTADALRLYSTMADDIMAVFETNKGCVYLSPNWERISGHSVDDSMLCGFYDCLHPDHVDPFIITLQLAICEEADQLSLYPLQFLFTTKDGRERWYHLKLGEIRTMENGSQQIACVLQDAHDTMQAQKAAREAQQEMEAAMQTRNEFLNSMSHDLRTPLNAILGFTQIMESGMYGEIANPQYRDYLRHIRESGYELLAQIDELMDTAHVEAGTSELHRERFDLHDLVRQAMQLHNGQSEAARVFVENRVPALSYGMQADRTKLMHALSHIITNAIRHCKPGSRIRIDASRDDATGELRLSVQDTGIGMSARKLQSLVSALQQDEGWPTREGGTLGFGLMLTREFTRMHGGYLTLDSKAGSGTTVTINLPANCLAQKAGRVLQYAV